MTYPSLQQYLSAIDNGREQFRTLKKVELLRDPMGEPIYISSRSWVVFAVRIDKIECSLRVFTSPKYGHKTEGRIMEKELYVVIGNDGDYYDIAIEDCIEEFVVRPENQRIEQIASENRIAFCKDDKWGFRDNNGRVVIAAQYDSVQEFIEGRAVVEIGSMYGLIDKSGGHITETIYDEMSYDGSHLCYVEIEGRCGVIDRMGRVVVPLEWDWVSEFAQDMLLVEKDTLYGYVDLTGRVTIEPIFQNATSFDENNYATVSLDTRQYQIDAEGNRV